MIYKLSKINAAMAIHRKFIFLSSALFFSFLSLLKYEIDLKNLLRVYTVIYFISHYLWSFNGISVGFYRSIS